MAFTLIDGEVHPLLIADPPHANDDGVPDNPNLVPTELRLTARATGDGAAEVRIGSLASLVEGTAVLRLSDSENPADPAAIHVHFTGGEGPLGALPPLGQPPAIDVSGEISGNVSLTVLGESLENVVRLHVPLNDFADAELEIDEERLQSFFDDFDFDLNNILAGLGPFLDLLSSTLREELSDLPLVGGGLEDLGGVIGDLKTAVYDRLEAVLETLPVSSFEDAEDRVRTALFDVLHNELGILLPALLPTDGAAGEPTEEDIEVSIDESRFEIKAAIGGMQSPIAVAFDTNLEGLPLSASVAGGLTVTLNPTLQLGFGIDRFGGFYLVGGPGPELSFEIEAGLTEGSSLDLDLFALSVTATDAPERGGTGLHALANVDFGSGDRIFLADVRPALEVPDVSVNLALDLDASTASPNLPHITAQLDAGWQFSYLDGQAHISDPTFALNSIELNAGEFLDKFIGPAAARIKQSLTPIQSVINLLQTPIPGLSQISELAGAGPITLLDLALAETSPAVASSTKQFVNFMNLIGELGSRLTADGTIRLGNIAFSGEGLLTEGWNLGVHDPTQSGGGGEGVDIDPSALNPHPLDTANAALRSLVASLRQAPSTSLPDESPGGTAAPPVGNGLDLTIDVFEDPSSLIKLLLGQTVNLVTWEIPELRLDFPWSQSFPILPFPPISIDVGLEAGLTLDFSVGFDTRGLQTDNLLDGFYFGDLADGSTGEDIHEAALSLGVTVAALLDAGIASAGIEGGIIGEVSANWRDPDADGKLYLSEINEIRAKEGLGCVFDLSAELRAVLRLVWEALFVSGSVTLADITLMETDNSTSGACLQRRSHRRPRLFQRFARAPAAVFRRRRAGARGRADRARGPLCSHARGRDQQRRIGEGHHHIARARRGEGKRHGHGSTLRRRNENPL
jgi:hypothetical protein